MRPQSDFGVFGLGTEDYPAKSNHLQTLEDRDTIKLLDSFLAAQIDAP